MFNLCVHIYHWTGSCTNCCGFCLSAYRKHKHQIYVYLQKLQIWILTVLHAHTIKSIDLFVHKKWIIPQCFIKVVYIEKECELSFVTLVIMFNVFKSLHLAIVYNVIIQVFKALAKKEKIYQYFNLHHL